jgi:Cys-tRNA(Pro)/Cys-tRNA(Cys) deacylase
VVAYEAPARHGAARSARPDYGLEAAVALGLPPARVCKTLVVSVDGDLVVAVIAVDQTLDLKRLAVAVGRRRAEMADPRVAERATGYVIGGISPLGQRRRLPTVLDAAPATLDRVHVSAGRRGLQLVVAPADLIRLADAVVADIAARPRD